jgi:hypothetical protein
MDEMTEVRALRANTPVPDRARLAPGRARLLEAARAEGHRRPVWERRGLVVAVVFVAVTAIAVTASMLVEGRGSARKVTPAVSPSESLDLRGMSARELLERAATAVEQQKPTAEPRVDQWIVTEQYLESPGEEDAVREKWIKYDERYYFLTDTISAHTAARRRTLQESEGDARPVIRSPREEYRFLTTLPSGAEGTLKALRELNAVPDAEGASRAERDHAEIARLLDADVQPFQGLAGLYRALATVPGGTVVEDPVEYGYGKRAIALRYPGSPYAVNAPANSATEWLFDPETYRVVGRRALLDGEVESSVSVATRVLVDDETSTD